MKNFQPQRRLWIGFFLVMFGAGCAQTPVRMDPDFASAKKTVKKVVVLTPDVLYQLIVLNGENERLPEKEKNVRADLEEKLPKLLEGRGYEARRFDAEMVRKKMKDADFAVEQVKSAYRAASNQLYERALVSEEDSQQFRVSIGPVGGALAEALDADAFLFTRYDGYEKSSGLIAKDFAAGVLIGVLTGVARVPATKGASMEMAMVNAVNGSVLWSNRGGVAGPRELNVQSLLAKLPQRGMSVASKKEILNDTETKKTEDVVSR